MAVSTNQVQNEVEEEEYHCLNETGGRIGPEGGRIEVMPGTWVVIDPKTLDLPTFVKVQVWFYLYL